MRHSPLHSVIIIVTAYKHFKGQVLGSEELDDLLTGLRSNGLLKYSYILTGIATYIRTYMLNTYLQLSKYNITYAYVVLSTYIIFVE